MIVKSDPNQTVDCSICGASWTLKKMYRVRDFGSGIEEHGLFCPSCKKLVHAYFMDSELSLERDKLDKATAEYGQQKTKITQDRLNVARQVYKRKFEKFQERVRKKFGLPEPGTIIVWEREKQNDAGGV